jgi:hypothetical protein
MGCRKEKFFSAPRYILLGNSPNQLAPAKTIPGTEKS